MCCTRVLQIFNQSFKTQEDIKRFEDLFEEICYNVAQKHGGSLKAEHGTGRNVSSHGNQCPCCLRSLGTARWLGLAVCAHTVAFLSCAVPTPGCSVC